MCVYLLADTFYQCLEMLFFVCVSIFLSIQNGCTDGNDFFLGGMGCKR